jgi:integrase
MASINRRTVRWTTREGEPRSAIRYEATYHDRNAKRHRRMFDFKRDAQRWLDEQTTGLVTGQWADPRAGKETFQTYAERWRTRQVHSPNTQDAFERILRVHVYPHIGGMRLDAIAPADVQEIVKRWTDSSAPTTVETRYTIMATVFRGAVRDRILPASPCVDVRLPRIEPKSALVPISTDTVLALHEALPQRYRAFVIIGAGTGMRRGELLGLSLDRVSVEFGTIRVDRQLARSSTSLHVEFAGPKTQASVRTIGVADLVLDAVAAHVATYGTHRSGLIFTSEVGSPVGPSVLHRAWTIAARKVGTVATPHDLRHYFASIQIAGGCSIKKLQQMLGHKSATETWDTYGHLIGDEDDRSRTVIQTVLGSQLSAATPVKGNNRDR